MKNRIRKIEKWTWQTGRRAPAGYQVLEGGPGSPRHAPFQEPPLPGRPSLGPALSRHPSTLERSPHLGHTDHAFGHVQVTLMVLADLCNDEARVLPAHPAPRTQLQLQRHRGRLCSPADRPARVQLPLSQPQISSFGSPAGPTRRPCHVSPRPLRSQSLVPTSLLPANRGRGRGYPLGGRYRGGKNPGVFLVC